jgi:hypothetical protein
MWSSKDIVTDMEEILNDTIEPKELEVSFVIFRYCIRFRQRTLTH